MKVMLDTNILISAFVFKSKKMNKLIYELLKNHEIVICSYTIKEMKSLIQAKFNVGINDLNEFLRDFSYTLVYSPMMVKNKLFDIRDKDDYIILHTAIIEKVDVFITGDKDFYDVHIDKPEVMSVSQFIDKYCNSIS